MQRSHAIQTFITPRPTPFPDFDSSTGLNEALEVYVTTNRDLFRDHLTFASTLSTRLEDLYFKLSISFTHTSQREEKALADADKERLQLVGDMKYVSNQIATLEKIQAVFDKSAPVATPNSPYVTILATIGGLQSRITSATKKEHQLNICIHQNEGGALGHLQSAKVALLASTDLETGVDRKVPPEVKPKPKKETPVAAAAAAAAPEPAPSDKQETKPTGSLILGPPGRRF